MNPTEKRAALWESVPRSEREDWLNIEPIYKGWSTDKKFRVQTKEGHVLQLRLSPVTQAVSKKREFEWMKRCAALGFTMSGPLSYGLTSDRQYVYHILSWVEGVTLEDVLRTLSPAEAYRLGCEAGKILKRIHALPLDNETDRAANRKRKKQEQLLKYEQSDLSLEKQDLVLTYIKAHWDWMETGQPVFMHGDFHPGNLIFGPDRALGVIDFNRWKIGDAAEEFMKLGVFTVEQSPSFCRGQIRAYFDDAVPENFWRKLSVYTAHTSVYAVLWAKSFGQAEVEGMKKRYRYVLEQYDHFRRIIPKWYTDFSD